jgi:hypothetical protein
MTFFRLSLRAVAITIATAALACGVIALAGPRPIESAVLGAEWQCMRTAFVVTTCAPRMQQATPAMETLRKEARHATRG